MKIQAKLTVKSEGRKILYRKMRILAAEVLFSVFIFDWLSSAIFLSNQNKLNSNTKKLLKNLMRKRNSVLLSLRTKRAEILWYVLNGQAYINNT